MQKVALLCCFGKTGKKVYSCPKQRGFFSEDVQSKDIEPGGRGQRCTCSVTFCARTSVSVSGPMEASRALTGARDKPDRLRGTVKMSVALCCSLGLALPMVSGLLPQFPPRDRAPLILYGLSQEMVFQNCFPLATHSGHRGHRGGMGVCSRATCHHRRYPSPSSHLGGEVGQTLRPDPWGDLVALSF